MTPAFERFIEPARRKPQIWRLVAGLAVAVLVYLGWLLAVGVGFWVVVGEATARREIEQLAAGSTPASLVALLFSFIGMALGAVIAAALLHRRGPASLVGPRRAVLRDFVAVAGLGGTVFGLAFAIWWSTGAFVIRTDPAVWLWFLPFALAGLLVQTGAEEILFRGYMQQQLAARFARPAVWLLLPSIAFGLVHYDPQTMGGNAWLIVLATGVFGLVAADLTARTGSLGAAWGLHFVNNVFALLIVTMGGGLDGLALFALPGADPASPDLRPLIALDIALLVAVWALTRRMLARRSGADGGNRG